MKLPSFLKKYLRQQGIMLIRTETSTSKHSISKKESQEITQLLKEFSAHNSHSDLQNYSELRQYLTDERMALTQELIEKCKQNQLPLDGKDIADVGSGMAYLFRYILQVSQPSALTGYDTYVQMLDLARAMCPTADFVARSLYDISQSHDIIFCMEVLEHMVDPQRAVRHLMTCCTHGGKLVLSVPNGRIDFQSAGQMREDGQSYWGHVHFWSPESWSWFLQSMDGCQLIDSGAFAQKHLYAILQKD